MNGRENKFTRFEGFSLIAIFLLLHVYSGSLPRVAESCANATWLSWIVSGVLAVGLFFLYFLLYRSHPGRNILEICSDVLGGTVGKALRVLLLLYFFFIALVNLVESTAILTVNTYSHTRPLVIAFAYLAVAYVVARYPVKGLARVASVCAPLFFFIIILILAMAWKQYEPSYLFPILGNGTRQIVKTGILQLTCYDGLLVTGVFLGGFGSSTHYRKSGLKAVVMSSALFFLSSLGYCMSRPYTALRYSRSGLLDIAQSIYVNRFFQRLESVFILFVTMGKILVLCIVVIALKKTLCSLVDMPAKSENKVLVPLLLLLLACGQVFTNQNLWGDTLSGLMRTWSLAFTLSLLALLLVCTLIRHLWRRRGGGGKLARTAALIVAVCLLLVPLGGCAGISEPDEEVFSIIMGYDKSDSETMRITVKVMPEDKNSAGGSGGGDFNNEEGAVAHNVFSVDAPCNLPAAEYINSVIPKHLSMLHINMLVISEEIARDNIDLVITPFVRYKEIKPSIAVVVCKGTAEDFINARTSDLIPFLPMETESILKRNKGTSTYMVRTMGEINNDFVGEYGDPLIMYGGLTYDGKNSKNKDSAENTGGDQQGQEDNEGPDMDMEVGLDLQSPVETPWDTPKLPSADVYYDDPASGYLQGYLPGDIPIRTAVEQQIAGMAVMRDRQMVGTLNTRETEMFMVADGSFPGAIVAVRDPYIENYYVMFYAVSRRANKVRTRIDEDGVAHIDVDCYLKADIDIVHNPDIDYRDKHANEMLRLYTEAVLQQEIDALVKKIQQEYKADSFRFGRYIARHFKTIEEWEAYNWHDQYENAQINIKVNLVL